MHANRHPHPHRPPPQNANVNGAHPSTGTSTSTGTGAAKPAAPGRSLQLNQQLMALYPIHSHPHHMAKNHHGHSHTHTLGQHHPHHHHQHQHQHQQLLPMSIVDTILALVPKCPTPKCSTYMHILNVLHPLSVPRAFQSLVRFGDAYAPDLKPLASANKRVTSPSMDDPDDAESDGRFITTDKLVRPRPRPTPTAAHGSSNGSGIGPRLASSTLPSPPLPPPTPSSIALARTGNEHLLALLVPALKLDPLFTRRLVLSACTYGSLSTLNCLIALGLALDPFPLAITAASRGGHTSVLDWWINSGRPIECPRDAMVVASARGHVHVLEWWVKTTGGALVLNYDTSPAIAAACRGGHLGVVKWWREFLGPAFVYFPEFGVCASEFGHVHLLKWFKAAGFAVGEGVEVSNMDLASMNGHVQVLEFWRAELGNECKYTTRAMKFASRNGHLATLEWWRASGLELRFTPNVGELALKGGHKEIARWWSNCPRFVALLRGDKPPDLLPTPTCDTSTLAPIDMDTLTAFGRRDLLDQLTWRALPSVSTPLAAIHAAQFGHTSVLEWWEPFNPMAAAANECLKIACRGNQINVLQWFHARGYAEGLADWAECAGIAAANGHVSTLDWLRAAGKMPQSAPLGALGAELVTLVRDAIKGGEHTMVLSWCVENGYTFEFDEARAAEEAVVLACELGRVQVLEWWRKNLGGPPRGVVEGTTRFVDVASERGQHLVLEWWATSGWELRFSEFAVRRARGRRVIEWWRRWVERESRQDEEVARVLDTMATVATED
ncbi:hypothetical protein BCR44DRAFT_87631 [Catenaria anguillulae PL171]|uniref:Ankyrin repeat-containing domain protein n=1 Tax=Catenaria anguillulae PL171 TaxID=765915 RepID=A0A1Y2HX96_9FUNG|nr:hypothetical protein BCR44DRAFT_87631 [Catenaria anguillulae PL171]